MGAGSHQSLTTPLQAGLAPQLTRRVKELLGLAVVQGAWLHDLRSG